ncbi:MAG: hypothetical protein Q9169_005071 [Polycauliona sp. 2 TL-2023]
MALPIDKAQSWVRPPRVGRWWFSQQNLGYRDTWKVAIDLRRIPWLHLDKPGNVEFSGLRTDSFSSGLLLHQWLNPHVLPWQVNAGSREIYEYLAQHGIVIYPRPPPILKPRVEDLTTWSIPRLLRVSNQEYLYLRARHGAGVENKDLIRRVNGDTYMYFHNRLPVGGTLIKPGVDVRKEKVGFYYGGPILNRRSGKWQTRWRTDLHGGILFSENDLPTPVTLPQIVRATAMVSSKYMTQSALRVGERILLSTLDFHHWLSDTPSADEVQLFCDTYQLFRIEDKVEVNPPSDGQSVNATLVAYSIDNDLGIFRMQDPHETHEHSIPIDWLLEREAPIWNNILQPARRVGCIAYNARTEDRFAEEVQQQVDNLVQCHIQRHATKFRVHASAQPAMKSFTQGTLDRADAYEERVTFGVSLRGYGVIQGPYNAVNGFPNGLKELIERLDS